MKNNILFISHSSGLDGSERSLLLILKNLDRSKYSPLVVVPRTGPLTDELIDINIPFIVIPMPCWVRPKIGRLNTVIKAFGVFIREIYATVSLMMIIRKNGIDLVHSNSLVVITGAISSIILRKPHVWHIRELLKRNNYYPLLSWRLYRYLIRKTPGIFIANSITSKAEFIHDIARVNIDVIYNAVDASQFLQGSSTDFKEINGVSTDDWVISVVGGIHEVKNQMLAIKSVQKLVKKYDDIRLLVIGDKSSSYANELERYVKKNDLEKYVIFPGFLMNVPSVMLASKVLLTTAPYESFGRVAVESMYARVPVIGIDSGGTKEIIKQGVTGFLVASDEEVIAEKLEYLINNEEVRLEMGKLGFKDAVERFSERSMINEIHRVYNQLL